MYKCILRSTVQTVQTIVKWLDNWFARLVEIPIYVDQIGVARSIVALRWSNRWPIHECKRYQWNKANRPESCRWSICPEQTATEVLVEPIRTGCQTIRRRESIQTVGRLANEHEIDHSIWFQTARCWAWEPCRTNRAIFECMICRECFQICDHPTNDDMVDSWYTRSSVLHYSHCLIAVWTRALYLELRALQRANYVPCVLDNYFHISDYIGYNGYSCLSDERRLAPLNDNMVWYRGKDWTDSIRNTCRYENSPDKTLESIQSIRSFRDTLAFFPVESINPCSVTWIQLSRTVNWMIGWTVGWSTYYCMFLYDTIVHYSIDRWINLSFVMLWQTAYVLCS